MGLPGLRVARKDIYLPNRMDKIVAVGVRVSLGDHAWAGNQYRSDLNHFDGIIPCGVRDGGVTSLTDLGYILSREEVESAARDAFARWFGQDSDMGINPPLK